MNRFSYPALLLTIGLLSLTDKPDNTNWLEYNGGPDRNHFSPLTQLNATNVAGLQVAWEYASGGVDTLKNNTQIQCNPLIIDGLLYAIRTIWRVGYAYYGEALSFISILSLPDYLAKVN